MEAGDEREVLDEFRWRLEGFVLAPKRVRVGKKEREYHSVVVLRTTFSSTWLVKGSGKMWR